MATYRTHGKESILTLLRDHPDTCFSVEQIHRSMGDDAPGQSTVYRLCGMLVKNGDVKKFPDPSKEGYVFQYAKDRHCDGHIHMQCQKCGRIFHLSCRMNDELSEHLYASHGFRVDLSKSILYGYCSECSAKEIRL